TAAGNVTVTGSNGGPFTIVYGGTLAAANQPQISSGNTAAATTGTTIDGNSTPPVTVTGAQGGPFTITFGGSLAGIDAVQIASSTAANATTTTTTHGSAPSATAVQTNLGAILGLTGNITVTGAAPSYTIPYG